MKHYGIDNPEGSVIINPVVPSGASDPAHPETGELFFRTDSNRLQVYGGGSWDTLIPATELATLYGPLAANNTWSGTNTFNNAVTIAGTLNCSGLGITQAYLPGDTKIYEYNNSSVAYFSANNAGSGHAVSLYIRTYDISGSPDTVNNAIIANSNCSTLILGTTDSLTFNGSQVALEDRVNIFTTQQVVQATGGSFIIARAKDVAHDSAFQGHLTQSYTTESRGFFGSIPSDLNSYITAYTWDTGSPQQWNRVFGAHQLASVLQLSQGNVITYNNHQLLMEGTSSTLSVSYSVTDQRFWDGVDSSGGLVVEQESTNAYAIAYNDDGIGGLYDSTLSAVKVSFNSTNGFVISARPPAGSPTSVYNAVFYANYGSQLLALGANLQYGGDNVALESRANLFKVGQTLYHNNPSLNWLDTATVDQNFTAYVQSGVFNLRGMLDSFATTAFTPLKADYNADTLYIQSGDITFNGVSLITGGLLGNLADVTIDGSPAPNIGDVLMYVDGSPPTWAPRTPGASVDVFRYTATAGQTSFSGADDRGQTLAYIPGELQVYLNGTLLVDGTNTGSPVDGDYTASDGSSIVLATGATAGNILQVLEWSNFTINGQQVYLSNFKYTIAGSPITTVLSGIDDNGSSLAYAVGEIQVFYNGVRLESGVDFTASTGTSVTLSFTPAVDDVFQITAFDTFNVANHYTKGQIDAKYNDFSIQFTLPVGDNDTYPIQQRAQFGFTINEAYYQTASGTISANIKIGGVSVTGLSALSLTSTEGHSTATANQLAVAGDKVEVTLSSDASAIMASIILYCTRT